jgi:uncharacterized protein
MTRDTTSFQVAPKARPSLERVAGAHFDVQGLVGERLAANRARWLLVAPDANPGMLQMFRDRDRQPVRDLVPWAGEFAGKYLTSAVLCLRLTDDPELREYVARFVRQLLAAQDEDGYLGVFPREYRLAGRSVKPDGTPMRTWDAWNHYHCLLGLLLWHQQTGDAEALRACRRAADLICRLFLDTDRRLVETGSEEMNLAPIHVFCLLYRQTGEARYLRMARAIEADFEQPPAGDYVRTALAGVPFHETPKPRWESLHDIQGIAELYFITGDTRYRDAFEHIWWSILEHDRHNTGGFSSGEKAQGNPYHPGAIETCCSIAWIALSIDMLRLTGLSVAADEIELSTFNAVLGAQSPTGRWWTYDTPMDGVRQASHHSIVFQSRPGTPELNCCAVNGPRGLGMLSEWAVMTDGRDIFLNDYTPGTIRLALPGGNSLQLTKETRYPADGRIVIQIDPDQPGASPLHLRVPYWSRKTRLQVNGTPVDGVVPGTYCRLERHWSRGDRLELILDFQPRLWVGEREATGKASIYRGPLLLAYDPRFNTIDPEDLPMLNPAAVDAMRPSQGEGESGTPAHLMMRLPTARGDLMLCDFASAGAAGNPYRTWLPFEGVSAEPFSHRNPLRATPRPIGGD